MSIFGTRNWGDALAQQRHQQQAEAYQQARWDAYQQSQRNNWSGVEFGAFTPEPEPQPVESDIARQAKEGTVIEGVAVRKPQVRLT